MHQGPKIAGVVVLLACFAAVTGTSAVLVQMYLNRAALGIGDTKSDLETYSAQHRGDSQATQRDATKQSSIETSHATHHEDVAPEPQEEAYWYTRPDWWIAGFTAALFAATTGLWIATWFLWRATSRAVTDGEKSALAAGAAAEAAGKHVGEAARAANAMSDVAKWMEAANKISRENLSTTTRAWLQPIVTVREIGHDDNNNLLTVTFGFEIKNLGNMPATYVHIESELIISYDGIREHQQRISDKAKSGGAIYERVIFPGDVAQSYHTLTVSQVDVDRSIQKYNGILVINIIGCVDYQFPSGHDHRQTWFAYEVLPKDPQVRTRMIRGEEMPIPGNRLVLHQAFASVHHAD